MKAPKRACNLANAVTPTVIAEELRGLVEAGCEKSKKNKQGLALDSLRTYERNEFSEPRACTFSYIEER